VCVPGYVGRILSRSGPGELFVVLRDSKHSPGSSQANYFDKLSSFIGRNPDIYVGGSFVIEH
jgi:hypothetical protein